MSVIMTVGEWLNEIAEPDNHEPSEAAATFATVALFIWAICCMPMLIRYDRAEGINRESFLYDRMRAGYVLLGAAAVVSLAVVVTGFPIWLLGAWVVFVLAYLSLGLITYIESA